MRGVGWIVFGFFAYWVLTWVVAVMSFLVLGLALAVASI